MKKCLLVGIFLLVVLMVAGFLFVYKGQMRDLVVRYMEQQKLSYPTFVSQDNDIKNALIKSKNNPSVFPSVEVQSENGNEVEVEKVVSPAVLPEEFNLVVPFISQAPFEIWDDLHDEACEEAAVLILDAFYKNKTFTKQSAEDEIQKLVQWENTKFGDFKDTTAEQTAQILREYFGYSNIGVVNDPTIEIIKRAVYAGNPVILPTAGRLLGNRYFRAPGPIYHMLVVRGWTKNGMIITNDPGTKRGEGYLYKPEILMNALHDWNPENIENGGKVMIVVKN